jgi:hypothetical protein
LSEITTLCAIDAFPFILSLIRRPFFLEDLNFPRIAERSRIEGLSPLYRIKYDESDSEMASSTVSGSD